MPNAVTPASSPLLTIAETCAHAHVSRTTVHRAISSGQLRAVRFGRAVRISPEDLSAYIAERASR